MFKIEKKDPSFKMDNSRESFLLHILEYFKRFSTNELEQKCGEMPIPKIDYTKLLSVDARLTILSNLDTIQDYWRMCMCNKSWYECADDKYYSFWNTVLKEKYRVSPKIVLEMKCKQIQISPIYLYFFAKQLENRKFDRPNSRNILVKEFRKFMPYDTKVWKKPWYAFLDIFLTKNSYGFTKPVAISKELAQFLALDEPFATRAFATKSLWNYIKKYNLQDPLNKKRIVPNNQLQRLLNIHHGDHLDMFNMQRYLNRHFIKK